MKKVFSFINSRGTAFFDFMLSSAALIFFNAGVEWEKQWMAKSDIVLIYTAILLALAVNSAYLIYMAVAKEKETVSKGLKAFRIIHAVFAFVGFGILVYAFCILFAVGDGIAAGEVTRAKSLLEPRLIYLLALFGIGSVFAFCDNRKKIIRSAVAVAVCFGLVFGANAIISTDKFLFVNPNPNDEKIDLSNRKIIFQDEFDGDKIDETKWRVFDEANFNASNTTRYTPDQVSVHDGHAYLRTEYRKEGKYNDGFYGAWLSTDKSFRNSYGYYEIRCIMPKAEGMHAAFWTFGDNAYSGFGKTGVEVDIFENAGYRVSGTSDAENCSYSMTIHSGDNDGNVFSHGLKAVNTLTKDGHSMYDDFHTYGLEWTKDAYIFYYDGVETGRIDFTNGPVDKFEGTCEAEEFLYLSTHVGSQLHDDGSITPDWNGNAFNNPEGTFPVDFIVDYVRVYAPAE